MAKLLELLIRFWPYLAGVALLFGAYLYVDHRGYERAETKKNLEIAQMEKAAAQSERDAWKQKAEVEEKYVKFAEDAHKGYAGLAAQYNANLLRYAQGGAGKTSSASQGGVPSGSNGPSSSPVLPYERLEITYEDGQICAENTARLQIVRNWALSILADQAKNSEKQPNPTSTNSSVLSPKTGSTVEPTTP